ncbi:MAG: hypothetical protein ABIT81_01890 [Ferruginibacter sp.]
MHSTEAHISRINAKLQQLLKQYDALQKENSKLTLQVQQTKEKQDELTENIKTLQQQNLLLKASVSNMEEPEKKKLEAQINNYLKNINTCISLLSE